PVAGFADSDALILGIVFITFALSLVASVAAVIDRRFQQSEKRRRQSEDFLRIVFETSADGIVIVDAEGRIGMANPAAERMFGRSLEGAGFGDVVESATSGGAAYDNEVARTEAV